MRISPYLACATVALALTGCSSSDEPAHRADAPVPVANPCPQAFTDQQPSVDFVDPDPQPGSPTPDGTLGVGLAEDGICLDIFYEMYDRGWRVVDSTVDATDGEASYSSTVSDQRFAAQFDDAGNLVEDRIQPALYVPLEGCVEASGRIRLRGPDGRSATWTADEVFGRDCAARD